MTKEPIFVGRNNDLEVLSQLLEPSADYQPDAANCLRITGPQSIGKTALVNYFSQTCSGERSAIVSIDFDNPYKNGPFEKLLELRNRLKKIVPHADTAAFDFAAVIFDHKFRDGLLTLESFRKTDFDLVPVLKEAIHDSAKKGSQETLEAVRKELAANSLVTVITTGSASVMSLAMYEALVVGGLTFGTITAITASKFIVKGVLRKAKRKRLFSKCPELNAIISEDLRYHGFLQLLAKLVLADVDPSLNQPYPYRFCFVVDPADKIGHADQNAIEIETGRYLLNSFDVLSERTLVYTSRSELKNWKVNATSNCTIPPDGSITHKMGPLTYREAVGWLELHGVSKTQLPDELFSDGRKNIFPDKFAKWWDHFDGSTDLSKEDEHSEDENV